MTSPVDPPEASALPGLPEPALASFASERPRLFAIAYRMLGSVTDAEDVLQDSFLRFRSVQDVLEPPALLTKIVVRLCIDHLRSARVQRELYEGLWLPEPLWTAGEEAFDRDSIGAAFLVLLESLSPDERAVYLLHDVFDYSHEQIGQMLGKRTGTCRQLLRRARAHVGERRSRFVAPLEERERISNEFIRACATGDLESLRSLLSENVRVSADSGGKVRAARKAIEGVESAARLLVGIAKLLPAGVVVEPTEMNGGLALLCHRGSRVDAILLLELDPALHITRIDNVVNPDKLMSVQRALLARGEPS